MIQPLNTPWNNYGLETNYINFHLIKKTPILPSPLGNSCKMVFIHHLHHWFFPTYFPISHTSPYFSHVALSISVQEILNGLWRSTSARFFMVFAASGLVGCGCPLSFLENAFLSNSLYFTPKRWKVMGKGKRSVFIGFWRFFQLLGDLGGSGSCPLWLLRSAGHLQYP